MSIATSSSSRSQQTEERSSIRPLILLICFVWGVILGFFWYTLAPDEPLVEDEEAKVAVKPDKPIASPLPTVPRAETERPKQNIPTFAESTISDDDPLRSESTDLPQDPPPIANFPLGEMWGITGRTAPPPKIRKAPKPLAPLPPRNSGRNPRDKIVEPELNL